MDDLTAKFNDLKNKLESNTPVGSEGTKTTEIKKFLDNRLLKAQVIVT